MMLDSFEKEFVPKLECQGIHDLFERPLKVPDYQRYYTWKDTHVLDLLNDIFDRKTPYLMGTIILHDTNDEAGNPVMHIVDGQQRLVTLTILLNELKKPFTEEVKLPLLKEEFAEGSDRSILKNRDTIRDFLKGKSDYEKRDFLKWLRPSGDCHQDKKGLLFSVLVLSGRNALDRAFTFFDSVNSKGLALNDFNLLKAHHLMFIPPNQEGLASTHNDFWESKNERHPDIFSANLRRLRMWSRGESRDSRKERPDYNEFCSVVDPGQEKDAEHCLNRYMQPVAFRSWRRVGSRIVLSMDYPSLAGEALIPTEITQTIEGGDPFFIYAKRYHKLYADLFDNKTNRGTTGKKFVKELSESITNDYLRNAFQAVMMLYVDKFGEDRLIEAAVCSELIISQWRWESASVHIKGTLSHVRDNRIVPILLDSVNSLHACSQLQTICQKLSPVVIEAEKPLKGVKLYYYDSIRAFYKNEQEKIPDKRIQEFVRSHYSNED